MSDELSPAERFAHEDEHVFVPRDLASGVPEEEIVRKLVRLDWSPEQAVNYVRGFQRELQMIRESPESQAELADRYFRMMLGGIALTIFGVFLTAATVFAPVGGSIVVVFVGLIAGGSAVASRGYSKWTALRITKTIGGDSKSAERETGSGPSR